MKYSHHVNMLATRNHVSYGIVINALPTLHYIYYVRVLYFPVDNLWWVLMLPTVM
jgi:hypothetical protein